MPTYNLIQSTTIGAGGAANIEFTSIPSTYTDLILHLSTRSSAALGVSGNFLRVNGSSLYYRYSYFYGTGSAAGAASATSQTFAYLGEMTAASATLSNTFCNTMTYIPNYAGSTIKTFLVSSSQEDQASSSVYNNIVANLWQDTSAITSLLIYPGTGNFVQYSTAYLYGISKA